MIRQICNVWPQDIVTTRSNDLLVQLGIEDLDLILKERRLQWYGHVECSSGAIKTAFDIPVDGKGGLGRPKMTWKQLTERDWREWKLSAINPHDRRTWRSGVRSAMRAASQLSGRGPTMWMLPLYLHVNQKSDYIWWWWYVIIKDNADLASKLANSFPRILMWLGSDQSGNIRYKFYFCWFNQHLNTSESHKLYIKPLRLYQVCEPFASIYLLITSTKNEIHSNKKK